MIEMPASVPAGASGPAPPRQEPPRAPSQAPPQEQAQAREQERQQELARLPVPPGIGRFLVLAAVFVCAACGLVYELELVALGSHLAGDSVTHTSVVLSVMVFAMGLGSLLAKRLRTRAAAGFGIVEALLALVGGGSAMALYAYFAWVGGSVAVLIGFSLVIGVLIGAEMPLLMTLIQRIRKQDAGGAVADLFAADYVGALVGGLAFPFLLLPLMGPLPGALVVGTVNAVAGGVLVLWLFRGDLSPRSRRALLLVNALVVALLVTGVAVVDSFERAARRAVYGGEVRTVRNTAVQEIVLTEGVRHSGGSEPAGFGMFLDGRLRVCGGDERRYHEALVHPAMAAGPHGRVLVLGGGDGLALREVLRHPGVESATVVELDPGVVELARTDPVLGRLNRRSLDDPRVRVETGDAFDWLRSWPDSGRPAYDVIVSDLPDPGASDSSRLYSQEFFGLAARALSERGRLAVHAGPAGERPRTYWTVETTLRTAGLRTAPYTVDGRLSGLTAGSGRPQRREGTAAEGREGPGDRPGDWGFVLAAHGAPPPLALEPGGPAPHAFGAADLRRAAARAEQNRIAGLRPSTLTHPRYRD
ncbi:polyamine aminopropyltransferase [Streptomyces sp. S1A]|uniref:polyamine aminopropyltransferase n=1 Tax=Streptomyces sp. ICN903 TaxID=2964654 RepID=UPI001EDC865E|nr:polyamine aminopropyltransferase [Streptomyces sp. ICN903]MCG3044359.1 polyamine aminopropyltransferase [Streptomyces sp. ICN903]